MDYQEFLLFCRALEEPWLQVAVKLHRNLLRLPVRLPPEVAMRLVCDLVVQARRHAGEDSVFSRANERGAGIAAPSPPEGVLLRAAAAMLRDEAWEAFTRRGGMSR